MQIHEVLYEKKFQPLLPPSICITMINFTKASGILYSLTHELTFACVASKKHRRRPTGNSVLTGRCNTLTAGDDGVVVQSAARMRVTGSRLNASKASSAKRGRVRALSLYDAPLTFILRSHDRDILSPISTRVSARGQRSKAALHVLNFKFNTFNFLPL